MVYITPEPYAYVRTIAAGEDAVMAAAPRASVGLCTSSLASPAAGALPVEISLEVASPSGEQEWRSAPGEIPYDSTSDSSPGDSPGLPNGRRRKFSLSPRKDLEEEECLAAAAPPGLARTPGDDDFATARPNFSPPQVRTTVSTNSMVLARQPSTLQKREVFQTAKSKSSPTTTAERIEARRLRGRSRFSANLEEESRQVRSSSPGGGGAPADSSTAVCREESPAALASQLASLLDVSLQDMDSETLTKEGSNGSDQSEGCTYSTPQLVGSTRQEETRALTTTPTLAETRAMAASKHPRSWPSDAPQPAEVQMEELPGCSLPPVAKHRWCCCLWRRIKYTEADTEDASQSTNHLDVSLEAVDSATLPKWASSGSDQSTGTYRIPQPGSARQEEARAPTTQPVVAETRAMAASTRTGSLASTGSTLPKILRGSKEMERAVFFSHSRRDAGALNLVYILVGALRCQRKPDGQPFSSGCFVPSTGEARVIPWLDKQQMGDMGGQSWIATLAQVQTKAMLSVFCLSNAFCGSDECILELNYAGMEKRLRIPVFLEPFATSAADFAQRGIAELCDKNKQDWEAFEISKNVVKRSTGHLQGAPIFCHDLSEFTCPACRGTRDSPCPQCTDWEAVMGGPFADKVTEAATLLGRTIDKEAKEKGFL